MASIAERTISLKRASDSNSSRMWSEPQVLALDFAQPLLLIGEPPLLQMQLDEYLHLRPQDLGLERLEHVGHRANPVSSKDSISTFSC